MCQDLQKTTFRRRFAIIVHGNFKAVNHGIFTVKFKIRMLAKYACLLSMFCELRKLKIKKKLVNNPEYMNRNNGIIIIV